MRTLYKSWIPSVAARLSFSSIGHTDFPARCVTANESDGDTRFIIGYQSRETLDVILPFKHFLAKYFAHLEGKMWFVCVAQTAPIESINMEKLEGSLFVFHNKTAWDNGPEEVTRKAQNSLRQLALDNSTPLDQAFSMTYRNTTTRLTELSSFVATFSLMRNGEIEVIHDSTLALSKNAPVYSNDNIADHYNHIVCSQLFFFLKDITHTHQHHNPLTDTLVDLHVSADDMEWRAQVLYALYRKIIQFKRTRNPETIIASLGTLAYTQTFRGICNRALGQKKTQLPHYDDESLCKSLEVARVETAYKIEKSSAKWSTIRNATIGVLGVLIALSSLLQLTGKTIKVNDSYPLENLASLIIQHTILSVSIVVLLVFGLVNHAEAFHFLRNMVRAFQVFKRKIHIALLLLLSWGTFSAVIYYVLS